MYPAIAIVGSNVPIASGVGLAAKLQGTDNVTACFFGDGASNTGAWHEGMNLAAVWDLPVVFICENNLYAASTPFSKAFDIENVAQRAAGYGMPGVTIDGNDVLAVYKECREAVERARKGQGPTMVECRTYRQCGHSRSDPRTYRSDDEEAIWEKRDPIPRFRHWLLEQDVLTAERLEALDEEAEEIVEEAISFAESSPPPEKSELYTHVFEE